MTDPQTVEAVLRDEIERLKTANKKLKKKAALANQDKLEYQKLYADIWQKLRITILYPSANNKAPAFVNIDRRRKLERYNKSQGIKP